MENLIYINKKEDDKIYTKRPGAYAIITRNEDSKIGIISSSNKHFYVGGKIEVGENSLDTLAREAIEEIGYTLKDIKPYKVLNSYEHSQSLGFLEVTANVFLVELDEKVADSIEKGYKLIWINPEEYVGKMNYYWHNYILDRYIEDNIKQYKIKYKIK